MSLQTITYIARRLKSKQSKKNGNETMQILESRHPFLPAISSSKNHIFHKPSSNLFAQILHQFFIFIFSFMACYTILQTILDFVVPYKLWKMRNFVSYIALFFLFSFTLLPRIHCAEGAFAPSFYTDEIYKELQNIAILLNKDIKSSLGFCIKDPWVLFHHSVLFFFTSIMFL